MNANAETVYVYHEYQDDQAYGEQIIRVFRTEAPGLQFLKERVEKVFRADWNTVKENADELDTVEPDDISIGTGNTMKFFILEKQAIID